MTLPDGKNKSLRHTFSSHLVPQPLTWETIITFQRRRTHGCLVVPLCYVKECVRRIESEFDLDGDLWTHRTPLPEGCLPELDHSNLLTDLGIRKF